MAVEPVEEVIDMPRVVPVVLLPPELPELEVELELDVGRPVLDDPALLGPALARVVTAAQVVLLSELPPLDPAPTAARPEPDAVLVEVPEAPV